MTNELVSSVPGVRCEHCRTAITGEVSQIALRGHELSDEAVRAAIDGAGYDAA